MSFEARSSSSFPTVLGFLMNKWTKMNVFHHSFLSFENNQPFWPLRILISYSLQTAKYVYISSHKPVSATLGSYPSYWERTRGLRLKPFFQPENIALYYWQIHCNFCPHTHCTMNTVHHFIYKRICASFETGKTIPNKCFTSADLG